MIDWRPVEHRDGLIAYELDFDTAAESEEPWEWIVERAELPSLRLFEAGDIATSPPGGGEVHLWEGEGGMAHAVGRRRSRRNGSRLHLER